MEQCITLVKFVRGEAHERLQLTIIPGRENLFGDWQNKQRNELVATSALEDGKLTTGIIKKNQINKALNNKIPIVAVI